MKSRNRLNGFTLIELMITVLIISILAAMAYPLYTSQVRKAARKEAVGIVLELAGRMERTRSQLFAYPIGSEANALAQTTRRYKVAVTDPTTTTFKITAEPLGDQEKDICGTLTYTNGGIWTFGNSQTQENCL